jgi:hypothetical protein
MIPNQKDGRLGQSEITICSSIYQLIYHILPMVLYIGGGDCYTQIENSLFLIYFIGKIKMLQFLYSIKY